MTEFRHPRSAPQGREEPELVRVPLDAPRPLWARLTAPAGPPAPCLASRAGANVLALPGLYCVTYLILGPDSVLVVDIGSGADHARIIDALAWLGRPSQQVRTVLPTHLHMDHVIGIDAFARRLGVPVTLGEGAHESVTLGRRLRFPSGLHTLRAIPTYLMQGAPRAPLGDFGRGLGFGFPWSRNRFEAVLAPALEHGAALPWVPGWSVLHTPGHADDAICLYHEAARFLIAGDTVRNFWGGEWNPLACDHAAYRRSKALLGSLAVETVFPGHGPIVQGERVIERLRTLPRFMP